MVSKSVRIRFSPCDPMLLRRTHCPATPIIALPGLRRQPQQRLERLILNKHDACHTPQGITDGRGDLSDVTTCAPVPAPAHRARSRACGPRAVKGARARSHCYRPFPAVDAIAGRVRRSRWSAFIDFKSEGRVQLAIVICPTGKSVVSRKTCPALSQKNIHLRRRANQRHDSGRPAPLRRGVRAIATDVGCGMQWTRWCRKANDASADGKIVWSRHPDAGVKFSREAIPVGATVAIKPGTPGRARYKL